MILITGTNLQVNQLPHNDMLEYQIDNLKMNIKLKTVAKSPACFQVYIAEDKRTEYTITDEIANKIVYFKDDNDLLRLLEDGQVQNNKDIFDDSENEVPTVEIPPDFSDIKKEADELEEKRLQEEKLQEEKAKKDDEGRPIVHLKKDDENIENNAEKNFGNLENLESSENSLIPSIDLEEANTDLPETMLQIPNLTDDTDSLKELLANKDRIIAQKDGMIKELRQSVDDTYRAQEIQLNELEDMWMKKLEDAQAIIQDLESKISGVSLDSEMMNFLKFIQYAQSNKAVVKEGFTDKEKEEMGRLSSNYTVFACGAGDSTYGMLKQIRKYIENSPDCIILDFTNDNFLASTLKINSKTSNTMSLLKDDINPISLLKDIKGTKFIPTTNYNDIALLNINWAKLLRKIDDMASGKQVILMFGNINNFSIRYTVSKLASIMKLFIFVKCSPIILSVLYSDVQFIPKSRVNLVALDYIDVVKNILSELAKSFNVLAFASEVEWGKLGLKK